MMLQRSDPIIMKVRMPIRILKIDLDGRIILRIMRRVKTHQRYSHFPCRGLGCMNSHINIPQIPLVLPYYERIAEEKAHCHNFDNNLCWSNDCEVVCHKSHEGGEWIESLDSSWNYDVSYGQLKYYDWYDCNEMGMVNLWVSRKHHLEISLWLRCTVWHTIWHTLATVWFQETINTHVIQRWSGKEP